MADMGEWNITTTIKVDGNIAPDFSEDWEVEYRGAKYVMPLRTPAARKEDKLLDAEFDLTFVHWAQRELQRWMFFTVQPVESGTAIPDKYEASVSLTLGDFVILIGQVLKYHYGDKITISLNPDWVYAEEPVTIEISYSYVWDVLLKLYELFNVRWEISPNGDSDHYVIKVGYGTRELNHIFEYGFDGGFLKVERQVQNTDIRNMLLGRGGEKNLPYRYFKDIDPENPSFPADPDWIPELRNIYFDRLRGKTFRDYIKGWKTNPNRQLTESDGSPICPYGSDTPIAIEAFDAEYAKTSFAYVLGHTDDKFNPVEYVADKLVVADLEVIPEEESSIDRYGPMLGGLDNNDEIYPSIQGVTVNPYGRIDQTVDVEQVTSDEVQSVPSDAMQQRLDGVQGEVWIDAESRQWLEIESSKPFDIPEGKYGNIDEGVKNISLYKNQLTVYIAVGGGWAVTNSTVQINENGIRALLEDCSLSVVKGSEIISASGIPSGNGYKFKLKTRIYNPNKERLKVKLVCDAPILTVSSVIESNFNTFDIWIKNVWLTEKKNTETDIQYAERVWKPILGDKTGNEAKIVFATGWLSTSEDYEFTIVKTPVYDTSKNLDGVPSHWRLTLAKCDADLESTGLLLPSTMRQGNAGDYFFFIGIDMPHLYVLWAEQRLDDYKSDALLDTRDIKPTWVVTPDRIRFNNLQSGEVETLLSQLHPGMSITLQDKRFIGGSQQEELYLQSLKITYRKPSKDDAALNPDIEMTLGNDYSVSANPVSTLQGKIDMLSKTVQGNLSNIEQAVQAVGNKRYLSKIKADRTPYDLAVGGEIIAEGDTRSKEFAEGLTAAGGRGWKVDKAGNGWLGGLHLRDFLEVPELRYNRTEVYSGITWHCPGGGIVESVQNDGDGIGLITLKLEDGEIGMVAEGDICMAFWHFPDGNATKDSDDGTGNFTFAGYTSVYFTIEEVEGSHNERIYIQCREKDGGEYFDMPQPGMHFVCYGNRTNKDRQKSRYATRSYERYLADVSDYTFGTENIMMQLGDLSNLTVNGMPMAGYSAYLSNVYFDGVIRQLQEMKLVEWQCIPNIIHCDADGAPTDTGISILAYHVQGNKRTLINAPGYSGDWEVRYKFTSDEGVTHDRLLLSTYIELDRRDRHPKFELAVIDTATGETVSEYEVGNVCDGQTGKDGQDGQDGKDGATGPQGAVVRMRGAYEIGEMYYAGDTEVNGVRWLDIVWMDDAYNNRTYYVCRSTHRYTQTWEAVKDNFEEMSYLSALFADIIIATQGRVKFLSSNEIVFGEGADIYGRIGAPTQSGSLLDLIMWLGGATAESATTTFSKDGVARFGRNGADRIEIDPRPNFRQIRIFNSDNDKVVTIDGREHDLNEAYQANDTRLTKSFANQSFMADGVYSLGQLNAGDSGVRLKGSMNLSGFLTSLWHQSAPPAPGMPDTDESYGRESAVTVSVVLMDAVTREDCYSESRYIESESITSGEIRDDNNDDGIQVDNNGVGQKITDISERFDFDIAVDGGSYYVALRVKFDPAIVKRWNGTEQTAVNSVSASNYTASLLYGDKPQCFIGQNGLIAANSPQDYLRAGVLDGEFTIEGVTKGNGIRLQGGKFYAKDDAHPEWAEITFNYK